MANPFQTPRSRVRKFTGVMSGLGVQAQNIALGDLGGYLQSGVVTWLWDSTNPGNNCQIVYSTSGAIDEDNNMTEVADVSVSMGGMTASGSNVLDGPVALPEGIDHAYATVSATADGTFEVDLPVLEYEFAYTPTAVTAIDGTNFPNNGGTAQGDGLPSKGKQWYEVPDATKNATVTVTFGGATASLTVSVATIAIVAFDYLVENLLQNAAWCNAKGLTSSSGTSSCQTFFDGVPMNGEDTWGPTTDVGGTNVASTTGGVSITSSTRPLTDPKDFTGTGSTVNWSRTPDIQYVFNGRTREFGASYPGSLKIDLAYRNGATIGVTGTGTLAYSWVQRRQGGSVVIGATLSEPIATLAEWGPVSCWLDSSALATAGEDTNDWRLQMRGFNWSAMTIKRTGDVTVDDCTATTHWTAGANTSLSVPSGHLQAAASGGVGSLTLAVQTSVRIWEAFRFLQITAGASTPASSPPATITINVAMAGQNWTIEVPVGAPAAQTLDLTIAGDETSTKNQKQSRFPVKSPGGNPTATDPTDQYKMGWGVDYCDSIAIGGIPDGYTLELDLVALHLSEADDKEIALTLLEPFLSFLTGWTDPSDTTTVQPFGLIQTDHRVSDIGVAMALVTPSGGGSPSYVYYSISQVEGLLGNPLGVTVTPLTDPSDGFHGSGQEGLILGGGGSTWDFGASTWTDWIDKALSTSSALTVTAQDLIDEIQVYPGCGQPFTHSGAYDIPTPLQVTKFLRGQAWGNCYKSTQVPYPSADVVTYITSSPSTTCGAAITGAMGEFVTGSPYGPGSVDITTEFQQGEKPYLSEHSVWMNRLRTRSAFRLNADQAKPIGLDVSPAGEFCRTYCRASTGTFFLGLAGNVIPQSWNDLDSGLTAKWARPRWHKADENLIGVLYGDGSTLSWARTADQGVTWTDTIDMGSGVLGDYCEDASGRKWSFKILSSDGGTTFDVWSKILDNLLNVVQDWTISNLTGVDDTSLACCASSGQGGDFRIAVFHSVGGSDVVRYSPDGLTFT